jgi:hypothetical protein
MSKTKKAKVNGATPTAEAPVPFKEDSDPLKALADQINDHHARSIGAAKTSLEEACAAGKALLAAKARVGFSKWGPWMVDNLKFTDRTAERYMLLAKHESKWRDKIDTESNLTVSEALGLINADQAKKKKAKKTKAASAEALKQAREELGDDALEDAIDPDDDRYDEDEADEDEETEATFVKPKSKSVGLDEAPGTVKDPVGELTFSITHWVARMDEDQLARIVALFNETIERQRTTLLAKKASAMLAGVPGAVELKPAA